ncbi:MAG TPA: alpha/beta fold hydrolase [Corynebacteriales bacterium]|nr:alpha/beta fold hydrolase [Mycobacteriales bacterium]
MKTPSTLFSLAVAAALIFGSAAGPASATVPTQELQESLLKLTGLELTEKDGEVRSKVFPALDFTYMDRLELADLVRKDDTGRYEPWGANNWDCTPSPKHPYPVVMVHGFNTTMGLNWALVSPLLVSAGYCTYSLNWGIVEGQDKAGYGPLREGAAQLSAFVDKVLRETGASQVDIVGHSAGGVMPHWYLHKLGGHKKVRNFFAITPATNGTDLFGIVNNAPNLTDKVLDHVSKEQPAARDLMPNSSFIRELHSPSPVMPGVNYTVIATRYDEMVTPVKSQFLPAGPNVKNYLLQEMCPQAFATHGTMAMHPVVFQLLENVLGDADYPIRCSV